MSNIVKLSITKNYISHWGYWQGLRELIQNAVDTKEYGISYGPSWVHIGSNGGTIPVSALLLGNTTKADDLDSIGKFGEGMKLGLLVLSRSGAHVTVRSGKDKWTPTFVYDDVFGTEILAVVIEKDHYPDAADDVMVEINNLPQEAVEEMISKFLPLQDRKVAVSNKVGTALIKTNGKTSTRLHVNGIFVTEIDGNFKFDYDFPPSAFVLDRDRDTASPYVVKYRASELLGECDDVILLAELACMRHDDLSEFTRQWNRRPSDYRRTYHDDDGGEYTVTMEERATELFLERNGHDAYPINEEWGDAKKRLVTKLAINKGFTPVPVSASLHTMIEDVFTVDAETVGELLNFNPLKYLEGFLKKHNRRLDAKPRRDIERTIEMLKLVKGE